VDAFITAFNVAGEVFTDKAIKQRADFDTTSNRLGNTVKDKNLRLAAVLKGVDELGFGEFEDNQIDLFGDAYEFLISNYAANAGKGVNKIAFGFDGIVFNVIDDNLICKIAIVDAFITAFNVAGEVFTDKAIK
jgi:hypothetical protein